jgi:monomeric sarcosine oxidase
LCAVTYWRSGVGMVSDDSLPSVAHSPDVVIIGAGLMGAASAWALTRRGVSVAVLEQYSLGHLNGSSHGSARIVRRAYSDPLYVDLTGRAFTLWDTVEAECGLPLVQYTGGVDFGPGRGLDSIAAHLARANVPHEVLSAAEAEARWPGMVFEGDVLYHAQAGSLDADAAVRAMLSIAMASGAEARESCRVVSLAPAGDGVAIALADGSTMQARHVVVAAGAWVTDLLGDLVALPPIHVTQQQVFHFAHLGPPAAPWPSAIHEDGPAIYHLTGRGANDDRKIGEHDTRGTPTTPASRTHVVDPEARNRVVDYVRRWLPGLSPEPRNEATCLYTTTPSEDFIVDRVGPIVVCSPCSGHGAKFAPLIGELVATLVLGGSDVPARFSLAAHLAGQTGPVSL